ncbi:hypothetical protein EDD86DRAFT_93033 [Gorgonomyces haynaldii]|nr:hypothetical protein EDD86DRAFT_93033 [Gorgonomyces haynaldii]
MFNLFWSDDIEICVFWEMDSMFGHLFHSGTNCSLEPLPIASWLSRIDQKQLEGRSLFEATARERRHLIASLLKRHADASPVRVLCRTKTHNSVEFVLGNTSWMHTCEFDLEVLGQHF